MAYNFLGLVNQICRKVNEVELTEVNFGPAQGFYSLAKDAVNRAIKDINNSEDYWRFNYKERIQLLEQGVSRYDLPTDSTTVDFDTFRIGTNVEFTSTSLVDWDDASIWADSNTYGDASLFISNKALSMRTKRLKPLDYDDYIQNFADKEFYAPSNGEPYSVVKTPTDNFIVYPVPNTNYPIIFDYYTLTSELILPTDMPVIPEKYDFVIFTGAMRDVSSFREDDFNAEKYEVTFRNQIKEMRRREINLMVNVRSGILWR